MKILALIPLLFLSSCVSRPKPRVSLKPILPAAVEPIETVRYTDVVRAYQIGRYVDPNDADTMHEQHPLFRVETHARWNLKPSAPLPFGIGALNPPADAAYSPLLTNDLVLAELNRQKDATERVMSEAIRLAHSYDELQKVIKEMTAVAQNQLLMTARMVNAERRVGDLESELRKLNAVASSSTNEVPTFITEPPDAAKP